MGLGCRSQRSVRGPVSKRACQWTALPTAVLRSLKQNLEYSECETEPRNTGRAGDGRGDKEVVKGEPLGLSMG